MPCSVPATAYLFTHQCDVPIPAEVGDWLIARPECDTIPLCLVREVRGEWKVVRSFDAAMLPHVPQALLDAGVVCRGSVTARPQPAQLPSRPALKRHARGALARVCAFFSDGVGNDVLALWPHLTPLERRALIQAVDSGDHSRGAYLVMSFRMMHDLRVRTGTAR